MGQTDIETGVLISITGLVDQQSTQLPASVQKKPAKQSCRIQRVNWHEAASCALQIDLRDYAASLEYMTEYILGKGSYRIDILVIKKLTGEIIPATIATPGEAVKIQIFLRRQLFRDDNLCMKRLFIDMIYSRRKFFNLYFPFLKVSYASI